MSELSNTQYKFLKQFSKRTLPSDEVNEQNSELCRYLTDKGFLRYTCGNYIETDDNGFLVSPQFLELTELGKSYLYIHRAEKLHWLIPVVISAIALIVSIFALYKSTQPLQINIETTAATDTAAATSDNISGKYGYLW